MSSATTHEHAETEIVVLRPEILRAGQDALAKAHPGARFQYAFHGRSGSKQQDLDRAISFGWGR
jgi:fructose/tagatose bisphosphate aldolase